MFDMFGMVGVGCGDVVGLLERWRLEGKWVYNITC